MTMLQFLRLDSLSRKGWRALLGYWALVILWALAIGHWAFGPGGLVSGPARVLPSAHGSPRLGQPERRSVAGKKNLPARPQTGGDRPPAPDRPTSRGAFPKG